MTWIVLAATTILAAAVVMAAAAIACPHWYQCRCGAWMSNSGEVRETAPEYGEIEEQTLDSCPVCRERKKWKSTWKTIQIGKA